MRMDTFTCMSRGRRKGDWRQGGRDEELTRSDNKQGKEGADF